MLSVTEPTRSSSTHSKIQLNPSSDPFLSKQPDGLALPVDPARNEPILDQLVHNRATPLTKHDVVQDFADKLANGVIDHIRDVISAGSETGTCFDIYIRAGVMEVSPDDSIEGIIEKGRAKQEIISKYRCDFGGNE